MDVDAEGHVAVTGAADCKLCVARLPGAKGAVGVDLLHELPIPVTNEASGAGGIASVCIRPDCRIVASGGWDRRVRLWQWRKWKPLAILKQHTAGVNAVHFSRDSRWLASASSDRSIAVWADLFMPQ